MRKLLITIAAVVLVGCGPSISIHKASDEGNIEVVKQHLAAGMDVNAKDEDSCNPLHWATEKGNKGIAELLIAKGADVNSKSKAFNQTPIDADNNEFINQPDIVDLLRKHGAKTGEELKAEGK